MYQIKDKVVWVLGASSGIGEHLALECAQRGAKVILSARRMDELERVKEKCGSETRIVSLDLANESSIESAVHQAWNQFGRIDFLFQSGGISQRSEAVQTPMAVDRRLFEVNYFGNTYLSKLIVPQMIKQGGGHIVVITSLTGKWGFYLRSAYAASKHALHGFYESLRLETENQGMNIVLVTPGLIATDISKHALNEKGEGTGEMDKNQTNGMPVAQCARIIVEKTVVGKTEFGVGGSEIKGLWVKRFFPQLFWKMVRKRSAR